MRPVLGELARVREDDRHARVADLKLGDELERPAGRDPRGALLDDHIHRYRRSARELWKFCNLSQPETVAWMLESARGEAIDWWAAGVASLEAWHTDGMNRTRLSTTVDAELLEGARRVRSGVTDAALIDEALTALLARHRAAEVDASYAAYDEHPLDEPDEWGDLASFRRAAAAS
jgi:hypothetical protein